MTPQNIAKAHPLNVSLNVTLSRKRVFADVIQDLEMKRSSWITKVDPKSYDKRGRRAGG